VLTVHSKAPDEALAQLDRLEDPGSPYRVVISVGMLKEGWDVKNVYVIASMRASVSEILTEQTLGRGLRLPFGRYTGVEILDTLEVLGHERYEDLLKKAGVLNQQFIDRRTRAVLRHNADGQLVPVQETIAVQVPLTPVQDFTLASSTAETPPYAGLTVIQSIEDHTTRAEQQLLQLQVELPPRPDLPTLRIPLLKMTQVTNEFSLADINDLDPFRKLGESIAADPAGALRRVTLGARIIQGADGLRRTELVTTEGLDRVVSPASLFPREEARLRLLERALSAPMAPARANQRYAAGEIVDAFLRGLGPTAEAILRGRAGHHPLGTAPDRRPTHPLDRRQGVQPRLHRGGHPAHPLADRGQDGQGDDQRRGPGQTGGRPPLGQPCEWR